MKMLAHRHHAAPHGESHPVISISVLLTALFLGAQGIMLTLFTVLLPVSRGGAVYRGATPFNVGSAAIGVLLLVFLGVDYHRNRIEAHGEKRFQYIVFAVASVALLAFLFVIWRAIQLGG